MALVQNGVMVIFLFYWLNSKRENKIRSDHSRVLNEANRSRDTCIDPCITHSSHVILRVNHGVDTDVTNIIA